MKFFIGLILLLNSSLLLSQGVEISLGTAVGVGSIIGDFPSQSTLGAKVFVESNQSFKPFDNLQFHFTYAQKVEKFLPGNYNIDYFSYMSSIGLSGLFKQKLNDKISVEEGIGIILLNDRSFDDIDVWNYGISFNFLASINLSKKVDLGVGIDYGLTFNNTNMNYYLFLIQSKYIL